jgi:CRISPR-associated exonuclease Cas4
MALLLALIALLLILVGAVALWRGRQLRQQTGMPAGEVVYDDSGAWEKQEQPLRSQRFGLVGRPDYLVRVKETAGRTARESTIPVEVKSRTSPRVAYESHILQLAAYCLLVEDHFKQRPPYGLLRYADATFKIPFTDALRRQVLDAADAIRRHRRAADVARHHHDPARCVGCGYRRACGDQALIADGNERDATGG